MIHAATALSRSSTWESISAAFICAFVCGTLGEKVGWHWGFGAAAVGMLAGLIPYIVARPKYLSNVKRFFPPQTKEISPFCFSCSP